MPASTPATSFSKLPAASATPSIQPSAFGPAISTLAMYSGTSG